MVLRIFKMIATSGFLTALECTKFVFGRCSAPGPTGGAYSTPQTPIAGLRGPKSPNCKTRGSGGGGRGSEEGSTDLLIEQNHLLLITSFTMLKCWF